MIVVTDRAPHVENGVSGTGWMFQSLTPYVSPDGWTLTALEADGDVEDVYEPGVEALVAALPLPATWDFLARLGARLQWTVTLDASGADVRGEPLRVSCVDGSYFTCVGSRRTELALMDEFSSVELVDPPPGEGAR